MPYYFNTVTRESRWDPPSGKDVTTHDSSSEKVRVSHLLIKHNESRRPSSWKQDNILRSKQEAIEIAKTLQKQIQSGIATLPELASSESDCPSAKRQGDMGYFGRGQMLPAFESTAFNLSVGQLSDPVSTDSGIHLILRTA
ncbi:Peptidyl-prolyl cis-trans isomerase pin1 [Smittium mucronatum]|uniref:Peptidyl-prolyl cis-trans isomerase n=1 Tax=Smittium mucronatum TaxID=133383 RepID=A0A1R0H6N7_9FUNG|nr:Peptidyl-prolyl cis-trans isomerase pin1 [Smittium mucronatum]